jgi:hypothetical protein
MSEKKREHAGIIPAEAKEVHLHTASHLRPTAPVLYVLAAAAPYRAA